MKKSEEGFNKRTENLNKMTALVEKLNQARKAYEIENVESMSNATYDQLYDELLGLEKELGVSISNSPTQNVGYEVVSNLPKEKHNSPMLSLDKTKDIQALKLWLGTQEGILSWKLDGLTLVLTYEEGNLIKAVTRGNGQIGEVITNNAKVFENIPLTIDYKEKLVVRGEAVIKYSDFEKINRGIEDVTLKYKNPRNLCSGTVRQLNNKITAERKVNFFAFSLVEIGEMERAFIENSREKEFQWLKNQHFQVVDYEKVNAGTIEVQVEHFKSKISSNDLPSDGLVLIYEDIAYGKSLGTTSKFPRDAIAFKWEDEVAKTKLLEIEWSPSRTGLINPVAIFEPVELEGTTVSRAGLHNISILEELKLEIGDTIGVYKANMIIPQVLENFSKKERQDMTWWGSADLETFVPCPVCPVCGTSTKIKQDEEGKGRSVKTLVCPNPDCLAKQVKSFTHFVSRDAINIDGLSEATLEKFIGRGFIKELADLFHLEKFEDTMKEMEGFGQKSFDNLIESIGKARQTTVARFLYSLGIPNIGIANGKNIAKACKYDWDKMVSLAAEELVDIDGIGEIMAKAYTAFFAEEKNKSIVEDVRKELIFEEVVQSDATQIFEGKVFVITGSFEKFENRNALKAYIEERGGKVTGSVTSKTHYLINNDNLSNSSKNKKAKELDIPILTELQLFHFTD